VILTPDRRLRVFVSSTLDLSEERAAARRSVEGLNLTPVMFEAGARPHPPRALYSAYVEQSDVFVAIYSQRYGWTAPGMDVSGLEDEFILSTGKPRLVYIQADVEREPQLRAFLERVREGGLSYRPFASAAELEALLRNDLIVLLTERFHDTEQRPGATRRASSASLPVAATVFLGREREVAEIGAWLRRGEYRLVTLVGPGGIGKTRLAIESCRRLMPDFPGGVFFVSLAALREPQLIADTIATALDVATSDAYPAVAAVADFIGQQRTLLILDNFEQVVAGAATVAELLEACAKLKVVVTSRASLRLRGEREFPVMPLAVPADAIATDHLRNYAAVGLFVEAARAVRPSFDVDEHSAVAVIDICRELDGLPLAIELAAAMVRIMTPEMLLDRLRHGLSELGGGLRDTPQRHRSLSETIAWSYDLLDAPTKEAFAQLSVFRGGFTLDTAEQICDFGDDVFSGVASLAEQSLLRADVRVEHGARFSMLSTIRQFASQRLSESAQRDAVLARHAQMFLELAEGVGRPGGRQRIVLDVVEIELDNVRSAFEWQLGNEDPDPVADAIWESWWFWWMRGYLREGKLWADRCLAAPHIGREPRARVLAARALFAVWSGDYDFAVAAFGEAAQTAREGGDSRTLAYADVAVGLVRALTASMREGTDTIRRGIATFEEIGDEAGATTGLVAVSWVQGITRQFDQTDEVLRRALNRARTIESEVDIGIAEAALAQYRMHRDDTEGVSDLIASSLEHLAAARHIASTILTLEVIAELGMNAGVVEASVSILGATAAIRSSMGTRVPPQAAARLERLIGMGRQRLGDEFDGAFARGATMSFTEAVDHGRALLAGLRQPTR
jgi:predicted ATPase